MLSFSTNFNNAQGLLRDTDEIAYVGHYQALLLASSLLSTCTVCVQEIVQHYLHIIDPSKGIVRLINTQALRLQFRCNDSKCRSGDKNVNDYDYIMSRDSITVLSGLL